MSTEEALRPAPLTAVAALEPHGGSGFVVRKRDDGAFRAVEPGTHDLVIVRPTHEGLALERPVGRELVRWGAVVSAELHRIPAGGARVPAVRLQLQEGPPLDLADALSAGADDLPFAVGAGGPMLLRVERLRLLTATIVAAAGLAQTATEKFERGARALPAPAVTPRPAVLPSWAPPGLLLLSVAALVIAFGLSWTAAVVLTLVIMVHEYGHAAAMRWTGMQVRGVLFLPFLGAATMPEHTFRTRWDEARVTLSGPLTGFPVALVGWTLLHVDALPPEVGGDLLVFGLALNLLNLLPLMPLDGGRIVLGLVAGLSPPVRAVAGYLPLAAVLAALVAMGAEKLAFGVSLLFAFSFVMTRLSLRRQFFHHWMVESRLPLLSVRAALRDVTLAFTGAASEDADGGVASQPLSASQASLVLALYMAAVLLLAFCTYGALVLRPELVDRFVGA